MAESVLPLAPAECTFDTLGLLTHGEFRCFQSPNPCLNLFTHGEFPRAKFEVDAGHATKAPAVGTGRKRRVYKPEVIIPCKDEDIIALTLLMAAEDDDDDWW